MPRFHVGESLMPETYWTLQRLGVLDRMKNSHLVRKYSVRFVTANGKESAPFFIDKHDPRECSQTWQVERAEFDKMLFDNAAEKGAECFDQTRVLQVQFDDQQRATGVVVQTVDRGRRAITARVIIDGTGQQSLIAHQLGLRQPISELRKAAIWGCFRDVAQPDGKHAGATVILHAKDKAAWFWFIPLPVQFGRAAARVSNGGLVFQWVLQPVSVGLCGALLAAARNAWVRIPQPAPPAGR